MTLFWYDWVGYLGVSLILLAYFLLQARKLPGHGLVYQLMNVVGAFGVLLSLVFSPNSMNWPAFFMELAWIAIGVYGMARGAVARREARILKDTQSPI